jgi:hypothetical protein
LVEIVSPANKDRARHVEEFADKAEDALRRGVHLLLVDLFPPGAHDPQGMHDVIWQRFNDEPYDPLPQMPLFLNPDRYINVPAEATYQAAFRGVPEFWRDVLAGQPPQGTS